MVDEGRDIPGLSLSENAAMKFRALRIHDEQAPRRVRLETLSLDDLDDGEVVVEVHFSSINYKDALAATGAGKILRKYPLVGGVDLAGTVVSSQDARYRIGQSVVVTGCGLSEVRDGGYAAFARVPAECVVALPQELTELQAMQLGTAGFTAAYAIDRMEHNGQLPEQGKILVSGATGGVGSIAIDMLSARGYEVAALTGKSASGPYLRGLGAQHVEWRQELALGTRALEPARWAGVVDNVGGELLSWLVRSTKTRGNVASIGLAGGSELHMSVMPLILRGVNMLGINSDSTPKPLRERIWRRIATDLKPRHLDEIASRIIGLDELPSAFEAYLQGSVTGRTVVRLR